MKSLKDWLMPIAVLGLIGVVTYDHIHPVRSEAPKGPAQVDGAALGRAFAPTLAQTLSDAWILAAQAIESGKSVAEAQVTLQDAWKKARIEVFTKKVAPDFARVLPEGSELKDTAERAVVASLWRSFAHGLKGGK